MSAWTSERPDDDLSSYVHNQEQEGNTNTSTNTDNNNVLVHLPMSKLFGNITRLTDHSLGAEPCHKYYYSFIPLSPPFTFMGAPPPEAN